MKSYGKVDASWDDARFQTLIEDAFQMAKKHEKTFVVVQDVDGNALVGEYEHEHPYVCACWASAHKDKESSECEIELVDNVEWHRYTVDKMVPRVRGVLTKGIVEYGDLGFLSEGRLQLSVAIRCAQRLSNIHHKPFIVGMAEREITVAPVSARQSPAVGDATLVNPSEITVAPVSARECFVEQAACVVTRHECWSLPDNLPDTKIYRYWGLDVPANLKDTIVSDLRSIRLSDPVGLIYESILEHWKQKRQNA